MSANLAKVVRDRSIPDPPNSVLSLCARPSLPDALRPDDIARAFVYTIEQPSHVRVARMQVYPMMPTG